MKYEAYRINMVTPEDVANGFAKDDVVFLHEHVDANLALFAFEAGGEEGAALHLHQVMRDPTSDVEVEDKPTAVDDPAQLPLWPEDREVPEEATADAWPEPQGPLVPQSRGAGLKYDGGKPRPSLLFNGMPRALSHVIDVLTFGAQKYEAHSWQEVENGIERYNDAKLRHMLSLAKGEEVDAESGIEHLAHEACNILFVLELALRAKEARA